MRPQLPASTALNAENNFSIEQVLDVIEFIEKIEECCLHEAELGKPSARCLSTNQVKTIRNDEYWQQVFESEI